MLWSKKGSQGEEEKERLGNYQKQNNKGKENFEHTLKEQQRKILITNNVFQK